MSRNRIQVRYIQHFNTAVNEKQTMRTLSFEYVRGEKVDGKASSEEEGARKGKVVNKCHAPQKDPDAPKARGSNTTSLTPSAIKEEKNKEWK